MCLCSHSNNSLNLFVLRSVAKVGWQLLAQFSGTSALVKSERPSAVSRDTLEKIGAHAIQLLNTLPPHARFRQLLIATLLRHLDTPTAASVASVEEPTVRAAFSQFPNDEDIGEFAQKYASHVQRQRIPELELELIKTFIREQCPGKSGQTREHYYQRITSQQLYDQYCQQASQLEEQLLRLVHANSADVEPSAALSSLVAKIERHEQELGFLSFLQSDPDSSRAFAGGHQPGPAQIVIDCALDSLGLPSPHPVSRGVFDKQKSELPLSMLKSYWGQFACATCTNGRTALVDVERLAALPERTKEQEEERDKARKTAAKYTWHLRVIKSQREAVTRSLDHISADSAVLLADFGSLHTDPNIADKDKGLYSVLVLVLQQANNKRTYIDVLVRDRNTQKSDFFFLRTAMLHLLSNTKLLADTREVTTLTDTGAKQFRSRYAFALFAALQQAFHILFWLLYRAERHGHSICDSHLGVASRVVTRHLNAVEDTRIKGSSSTLSPITSADTLADVLRQHFSHGEHAYHCLVLDTVDRSPALKPQLRRIAGTMKLHEVSFASPTELNVKQLSSDAASDRVRLHMEKPWRLLPEGACWCGFVADCVRCACQPHLPVVQFILCKWTPAVTPALHRLLTSVHATRRSQPLELSNLRKRRQNAARRLILMLNSLRNHTASARQQQPWTTTAISLCSALYPSSKCCN